ncbi:MAG TPA: DMT family transporter [Devosiaceae bacterium]|nr:DMT family transporter [Devosiaceae bacterium]
MNQLSSNRPVLGAGLMLAAGVAYAGVNLALPVITYQMGFSAPSTVFWQYLIASLFSLPLIFSLGLKSLKSRHPAMHILRVVFSAAGAQAWGFAFAAGVPLWQVIALVMTSPFFIILGAAIFLRERVTPARLVATGTGFVGGMIILQPWSSAFTWASLLPVAAAALWGGASLMTKYLTRDEKPESITLYLLLLLTPINALFLIPAGLALPTGNVLWLVVGLGLLTALSQYLLTKAYAVADATYLQPFDDLKLPLNLLASWVVLSQVPGLNFWPGALLIVSASLYIMTRENRARPTSSAAVA